MNHKGTKTIETSRLILRKFKITDAENMYKNWATDPMVTKYVTWDPHKDISETKELLTMWVKESEELDKYKWVIELKETKEVIGGIDLAHVRTKDEIGEIGYCLSANYWNKGYMSEALLAIMEYLFNECNFYILEAKHIKENIGSGKVMQKCHMKYDGRLRERFYIPEDNARCDLEVYSLTKDEYNKLTKNN